MLVFYVVSYCDYLSERLLRVGANSEISILAEEESIGFVAEMQLNISLFTSSNHILVKSTTIHNVSSFKLWFRLLDIFKV